MFNYLSILVLFNYFLLASRMHALYDLKQKVHKFIDCVISGLLHRQDFGETCVHWIHEHNYTMDYNVVCFDLIETSRSCICGLWLVVD